MSARDETGRNDGEARRDREDRPEKSRDRSKDRAKSNRDAKPQEAQQEKVDFSENRMPATKAKQTQTSTRRSAATWQK